jgi:Xaa-Pro dipeptidase
MFAWPSVDEGALLTRRRERVVELMSRRGLDHLVLTSFDAIRYATDYRSLIIAEAFDWFAVVMDVDGECDVFVPWVDEVRERPDPQRPWIASEHPMPSWTPLHPHLGYWVRELAGSLRARGARRVGFELVYADLLEGLRSELEDVELAPVAADLQGLRVRKEPAEIELLAAASQVNSRAADAALRGARAGMLDFDVLGLAMDSLQRAGVEFLSHSLCNVRRGSGTWFAAGNELREGDAFFFDIGCYGPGGYASDMARTGFVGEPPTTVQDAYRALLEALRIGEETARPGVRASEIHEAVNVSLRSRGLPITPYSVGHGVGLRACELPTIHRADRMDRDQALEEGMVISLEPETGVEVDGRFVLLKVEDNYVVEADGLRRMTDADYGPLDV